VQAAAAMATVKLWRWEPAFKGTAKSIEAPGRG
jgi:hypothetical protein